MRRSTGNRDVGLLYLNCKLDELAARDRLCVSRIFVPSRIAVGGADSIFSHFLTNDNHLLHMLSIHRYR